MNKTSEKIDQSYWGIVKRQFKKNKMAVWSLRMVYVIMFIGIMADFIANDKPFFCRINGNSYFPIFKSYGVALGIAKYPPELSNVNWNEVKYDFVIRTPIPYSPQNLDLKNKDYKSPLDEQDVESSAWRHHLGTDNLGRDVLAGMVHGTRTAMLVGIISMSISVIIGIFFGALAGYFGDKGLQMSRGRFWLSIFGLLLGIYYAFGVRSFYLSKALAAGMGVFLIQLIISLVMLIGILTLFNGIAVLLKRIPFFGRKVNVPVDILVSRLIEVKVSIPTLLLILSIVAVMSRPNILMVMIIIGFTSWPNIAKYTRAELLKVRSLEFIQAAQSLGYSELRTIFKHALPNSLSSVLVAIAFGVAGAILLESSLSFLGIGMKPEDVTWGSMLSRFRHFCHSDCFQFIG